MPVVCPQCGGDVRMAALDSGWTYCLDSGCAWEGPMAHTHDTEPPDPPDRREW